MTNQVYKRSSPTSETNLAGKQRCRSNCSIQRLCHNSLSIGFRDTFILDRQIPGRCLNVLKSNEYAMEIPTNSLSIQMPAK
ncbi:hypothetical protein CEXT_815311 [Caerostris extrusa]|uniref:Uncharacterized protein n=1 Tax=Caerostris extrusa TaxID=172846 RepID=A0AAV4PV86_CAEEX|nr:hypothetical protein CEXT_815311 [Caerostris extrusa]